MWKNSNCLELCNESKLITQIYHKEEHKINRYLPPYKRVCVVIFAHFLLHMFLSNKNAKFSYKLQNLLHIETIVVLCKT